MRLVDQVFVKYAWTRLKVDETLRLNKRRYFFFFFFCRINGNKIKRVK